MTLPGRTGARAFTYDAPVLDRRSVRVVFGAGGVAGTAPRRGRSVDRRSSSPARTEDVAADAVGGQLGARLVGRLRDVAQHVPVELAADAATRAGELGAEVLIAVGGGLATGLAKAVALETGLPVLAVPTTYAGSEMTPIWGRTDPQGQDHRARRPGPARHRRLRPGADHLPPG